MTVTINGTTGIAGTNGSAGTPAVQGEDTNTGIFFPAADTVAVATAGVERLRIDSSGNVGIGTSSPANYTNFCNLEISDAASGLLTLSQSGSPRAQIYYDGNVRFDAFGAGGAGVATIFASNVSERARIDSSGNLLVGTTSNPNSARLNVLADGLNAPVSVQVPITGAYTNIFFRNPNGNVGSITTSGSSTSYATSSDYRLKENVAPMQNALDTVAQLNPVNYTWKADGSAGQGFIAHELQAVVPDCVTGEKDAVDETGNPQYQGVDTSFLVATLVKAIQELKAEVDSLRAQLNP